MEIHNIEDNQGIVQYISLARIYDALIVLLRQMNPEEAEALTRAHEQGILLAPPPSVRIEREES